LVRIYPTAIIVGVVISIPRGIYRGQELRLQLDAYAGRDIDIRSQLYPCSKMAVGSIAVPAHGRNDIGAQQQTEEGPHRRVRDRAGKNKTAHDIILVEITTDDLCTTIVTIIVDAGGSTLVIVQHFKPKIAGDIEIHGAAQVQPACYPTVIAVKIISCRKAIACLGDEFHCRLRERARCREQKEYEKAQ